MAARNFLPRCTAFELQTFNDSIGIRLKNAVHLGKKFLAVIFSAIVYSEKAHKILRQNDFYRLFFQTKRSLQKMYEIFGVIRPSATAYYSCPLENGLSMFSHSFSLKFAVFPPKNLLVRSHWYCLLGIAKRVLAENDLNERKLQF